MSHIESPIFPIAISLNSAGGPSYNTDVIELNSGNEQRNAIWTYPRHRYDIGVGIRKDFLLEEARAFFHICRGQLHSFNYRDHNDELSCLPRGTISDTDQFLVATDDYTQRVGDGVQTTFQVVKEYYSTDSPVKVTQRVIKKLQPNTLILSLDGVSTSKTASPGAWSVDEKTGIVTFAGPLANGVVPKCGFKFYVKCRFATDYFPVTRIEPGLEQVPITLVEVR